MKNSTRVLVVSYVGWMFDFYDLALFSFLLPQIGAEFHLSGSQEAWLLGLALGTSGLGGIAFGWLADRYGRKPIMTWTVLLFSIGTALSALAPNITVFFVLRALTGFGIGGEWAVGHALVAESVEPERRGRAAAWLQSGEPMGVALAAVMGFLVAPRFGWRAVMAVSGLSALWVLAIRSQLQESEIWKQSAAHSHAVRAKARAWLTSSHGIWIMVRAFFIAVFKLGTYWSCYVWLPKFFLTKFHEPIGRSALWILTAQAGQLAGMIGFGRFADLHGRRLAFTLYSALSALALAMLAFHWAWLLEHRPLFWITMLGLGLGSGCTAGFGALLAELFPTEARNLAMGLTYNVARGMQIFAPTVVLFFYARWDVLGALAVPMTLAVLTGISVWSLPETRGRDLQSIQ